MLKVAERITVAAGMAVGALLLMGVNCPVQAQPYPASHPIRFIVPYSPGGAVDFVSRTVADKLSKAWGCAVIVDNRPGGGTNIGSELAARSAPDGYTFLLASVSNTVNMTLYSQKLLHYDIVKDFAPVCMLTTAPNVLVVHPSLPARSVKELISLAKSRPNQLTFGSAGIGSSNHLSGELFKMMADIDIVHVPYKGGGSAVTDILGGHISMFFGQMPTTMPHVRGGMLRALGVTSAKRSKSAPDLPTIAESGLPGFEQSSWHGLLAPAGTPQPIINKLYTELARILRMPDVEERLAAQGVDVVAGSPAELATFIRHDVEKYSKLLKKANITLE